MAQQTDNSKSTQTLSYEFWLYCKKCNDEKYILNIQSVYITGVPHQIVFPKKPPEWRNVSEMRIDPLPLEYIIKHLHEYNEIDKENPHFQNNQQAISYIQNDLQNLEANQHLKIFVEVAKYQQVPKKGIVTTLGYSYYIKYSPISDIPEADASGSYPLEEIPNLVANLRQLWGIFLDRKREELNEVKAEIDKKQKFKGSNYPLSNLINTLKSKQRNLAIELKSLQPFINKKVGEVIDLNVSLNSYIAQLHKKTSESDETIKEQQVKIQSLEEENRTLQEKATEADKLKNIELGKYKAESEKNETLQQQLNDKDSKIKNLNQQLQQLSAQQGEQQEYVSPCEIVTEPDEKDSEIEMHQDKIRELNNQIDTIQTQISELDPLKGKLAQRERELESLTQERDNLRGEKEQIEQTLQNKTKEAKELNTKYDEITQQLENEKETIDSTIREN